MKDNLVNESGGLVNDCISRQAAIDALDVLCQEHRYKIPGKVETYSQYNEAWQDALDRAEGAIGNLPSAQPKQEQPTNIQDILEYLDTVLHPIVSPEHWNIYSELYDMISALPSAQPQRWIPVTERLPDERDWYLGIFAEPDTGWINPLPFICDYLLGTKTKATTKEGWILKGFTDREEHIDYYFNLKCVAWMPLPEPYKGE